MTYLHAIAPPAAPLFVNGRDEPLTRPDPASEADAELRALMGEIRRQLGADDLLVGWHDPGEEPVVLFADDRDPRGEAERLMIACASQGARSCIAPRSEWRDLDGASAAGVLTTSIPAHGGVVTVTGLFRKLGGSARAHAREAGARLMPLMQPVFRMWSARRRLTARVRGLTAAVNGSDVGVLLVDRGACVLFANAAAEAILAQNNGLRRKGDLLSAARLSDTLRLRAAIEHVFEGEPGAARCSPAPVVALERRDRRPLLVAVMPADADAGEAVAYLFDPEQDLARIVEPVCRLYGLSPVEARLTALLTDGTSLAEAAARMRVREQTARSYLKQIFAKTQTSRQAELVWLMLKSSVRTAPGRRTSFV